MSQDCTLLKHPTEEFETAEEILLSAAEAYEHTGNEEI
jgi:hypothetical protein